MSKLTFTDHTRIFKDFTYIYPVLSRRSQGVSLGINLNVNNACNWRCIYCQVEGLERGKPITIDLAKLELELDIMLDEIVNGAFLINYAPVGLQRFNDISISGNGESTLSKQFLAVVQVIAKLRIKYNIKNEVKSVLITNGSEVERADIQEALQVLNQNNGEVWFKIDSGTPLGINQINQVNLSLAGIITRLNIACKLCSTYVQTCLFKLHGKDPSVEDIERYINLVSQFKGKIAGVLLYSVVRNPMLPEGRDISQVELKFLENVANQLIQHGIAVKYYE